MRCYLNELAVKRAVAGTPRALQNRVLDSLEEQMTAQGLHIVDAGQGYVDVRLDPRQQRDIFSFLSSEFFACVDIDAADVVPLMGSSIDAFVVQKSLSRGDAWTVEQLSRIMPHEITERLRFVSYTLQSAAVNTPDPNLSEADAAWLTEQQEAEAERELERLGLIERRTRQPLEPAPEPVSTTDYGKYSDEIPSDEPNFNIFGEAGIDF